ncbi:DUF4132 domain-containing protein [Nonomuraea gerenzanensis]|uniref:Uncharacterized protein n=1 Tax=Nonomuraea gerenzanensis TaxID=93944 RepID=A0A1M4EIF7_9ACTN|nr:DUF4132 domain-containing protein [Nonomuraea gerenzanensis]UBU10331.1 DUF4132 domain-containing protein [Nonomuraea gerenzanensis]SBO98721.1 FIG01130473: hypothetical protein [Nonomuraea gerenzanensis]
MDAWGGLSEADEQEFARLDAAFEAGEELIDEWGAEFATWAHVRLCEAPADERRLALVEQAARGEQAWDRDSVTGLWQLAIGSAPQWGAAGADRFRVPLAATASLPYPERWQVLHRDLSWLRRYRVSTWELIGDQVAALLTEPETGDPAEAARNVLWEEDPFAARLLEAFAPRLGCPQVLPLLRHWATARDSRPGPRWQWDARELLTGQAVEVIPEVLRALAAHRETTIQRRHQAERVFVREHTATTLRGLIWTCELIKEPWVTPLLGDVAVTTGTGIGGSGANARSELLANAAIGVLARRGGVEVVPQLARVQAKVRKKTILAAVDRTLHEVAGRAGLSPEQLLDRTVPTFGLGRDGTRTERGLSLSLDGRISYEGRKTIPKTVDRELLAEFRATAKELQKAVPAERFRIERALATERIWRWRDVCEHFLDHPVTGALARDLIWEILQGPAGLPVQVDGAWELTDPAGRRIQPFPDTPVLLWHPIAHDAQEVRGWRDHLIADERRQPFKQAFREVYLLTPAEEVTRDHSRRFARHLLRYGQAKALLSGRGWTGMSLGHWDWECGSHQSQATKNLPGGLTAHWEFHLDEHSIERDGAGTVSICVSGELYFSTDGRRVRLAEVPPLTLSEVLRDADLTVGVASTGLDPEGHGAYWESCSFGDLSESAEMRRDALARLLPRLAIADRCTLDGRFLHVKGDLRTYKIHLGSGNILMEPNDAYLCIVRSGGGDQVFLPFEEDGGVLSLILSKAFLLAADTAITDPSIIRQIR